MDFLYDGHGRNRRLNVVRLIATVVIGLAALLLVGACTVAMVQSSLEAERRCEAAGGFYEADDGECEFPGGDDDELFDD